MTNEQLMLILIGLRSELRDAIDQACTEVAAALNRPPIKERVHNAKGCLGVFCNIPEHFYEVERDAPLTELGALTAFVSALDARIDLLKAK